MTAFPDHPFWDFSLALYARPGVSDACLRLQDGPGLDVNLLLYACWTAVNGGGRLSPAAWRRLIDATEGWRSQVVAPLRRIRRFLKGRETMPGAAGMRERVQTLELDAEHTAQLAIADLADPDGAGGHDALAAMTDYAAALDIALSDADRADFAAIAAQVSQNMAKM